MSLSPSERSSLLGPFVAVLSVAVLCARAPAQAQPDRETAALLAKIDAARGTPSVAPPTLSAAGTFTVTFAGVPTAGTVLEGKFHELFAGTELARHEGDLGDHGLVACGTTADTVWEVDPMTGAKIHAGAQAQTVRRYFAILRGARPRELYSAFARTGTAEVGGRSHEILRMTVAADRADTWYVDPESGRVGRVDILLPASEGAQAVWGFAPEVATTIEFGDWRRVEGVERPHRRAQTMGPATFTYTCAEIAAGKELDEAAFAPPPAVRELARRPASRPDVPGAQYQLTERAAQAVASIRVTCKPDELTETLAVLLPEVMAHVTATGVKIVGVPFTRYHAAGPDAIDLETGIPVARPFTEKGRVKNSELPAGRVVVAWHVGPYEKLPETHAALQAHLATQGLKARGGVWEMYWTDPGMVPDPAKWRTQLFAPVD